MPGTCDFKKSWAISQNKSCLFLRSHKSHRSKHQLRNVSVGKGILTSKPLIFSADNGIEIHVSDNVTSYWEIAWLTRLTICFLSIST